MVFYKKELKRSVKGFLCGMLLYIFMVIVAGHFALFSGPFEIPSYLLRRLPYGIIKCLSFGAVGYLISLFYYAKMRNYNE